MSLSWYRYGKKCECESIETGTSVVNSCRRTNTSYLVCEGNGKCSCDECDCNFIQVWIINTFMVHSFTWMVSHHNCTVHDIVIELLQSHHIIIYHNLRTLTESWSMQTNCHCYIFESKLSQLIRIRARSITANIVNAATSSVKNTKGKFVAVRRAIRQFA